MRSASRRLASSRSRFSSRIFSSSARAVSSNSRCSVITFSAVLGQLVSSPLVAYAFARLKTRGRDALFVLVLSTMMLPSHVTMIPLFIVFKKLGWVDTYLPLILPNFFGSAYFIFLLRQFFLTIPRDLGDAAKIDGCGYFGTFSRIFLPLSKPALATVAIS